jgi:hypothetical protein
MSSARWMTYRHAPEVSTTGMLIRLQKRLSKPPRPSGMSYSCSSIVSISPVSRARSKEPRTLATPPSGSVSFGLPGKASNTYRPTISSRVRPVVARYAGFASAMTRSGVMTR